MVICEFQAVVMAAGKGSRMTDILGKKRLKCLLPIGNLPMVWYPLHMLEKNGFIDVILVVLESVKNEIQSTLEKTGLKLYIEIVGIPEEDWGTADTLRYLEDSKRLKSDVVVVSCDLITDVDLSEVFNLFRRHDAALSSLMFHNDVSGSTLPPPGPKSKNKPERDIIGIDPATNRLVLLSSESDYEETLSISRGLLRKHGKIQLYSKLLDSHLYIIKHWLCQYLSHNRNLSTIKGELLPFVIKKQYIKNTSNKVDQERAASLVACHTKTDIQEFAEESNLSVKIRTMSSYNDHRGDRKGAYHNDIIKCYAYLAPKTCFASRVNTLAEFCRVNREIILQWPSLTNNKELIRFSPEAKVLSLQVDRDTCLIADGADISDKTSIKFSNIGSGVIVKPKTRIANCVVMKGVKIGEGCVLNNCVLCENAVIGENCELKDCLVGNLQNILPKAKLANEVLTGTDTGFCYFD